ncbi:hypothetical protein LguiB_016127 [Lonicera macranthoides]
MGARREMEYSPSSHHLNILEQVVEAARKAIGARFYTKDYEAQNSTRDTHGHGTHTASTTAGNILPNASFYGLANGTARGGLPSTRIAPMGGDIITISIGGDEAVDIASDSVAIGAFHAMDRGVLTVQAAGNGGPAAATVSRIAPWILLLLIDGLLLKSALPVELP